MQPQQSPRRPVSDVNIYYRQRARRRRKRQRRRVTLAVSVFLLVSILVIALLIAGRPADAPSSLPASSAPSVPAVASVPSSVPSSIPVPQRTPTPYDEAEDPYLFNFENPIPEEYTQQMDLIDVGGGQTMNRRAGEAFIAMRQAAEADGIALDPISGYRSHERQKSNYEASINRYLAQGMDRERAIELTEGYYAIPGTSEHEAGLAMDIGFILDSFEDTEAFTWLQKNAVTYGFIMRYASDTFDITHIHYEPWHYRYVGANHAEIIVEQGITLEEYIQEYLPQNR